MRKVSVCPSVRLSVCLFVCQSVKRVHCGKTQERCVQIFIPYKDHLAYSFVRRRMECQRRLTMRKVSVCPFVCLFVGLCLSVKRVHCGKTEERCVHQSRKAFIGLTIRAKMIGGGRPLLRENLAHTEPLTFKTPIFDLFSPLAPQP